MRLASRMLITLWVGVAVVPAEAQFDCPPDVLLLSEATPVSGTAAVCYQFQVPEASPFVRFDLDASDAVDLYFTEGLEQSLSDWDRINVGPIEGDAKFVLLQPDPGDYTVAVSPEGAATYSLSASAGVLMPDDEPLTICSDDGVCSTALFMKQGPQAIELGSKFGDRVILPLTVTGPGKIEITAHWLGTAHELVLILNGPKRPDQPNPDAYYGRGLGPSPLTVTYNVTPQDLENGKRFQVSLVNFSGGEASGGMDIKTPPTVRFNFVKLAKLATLQPYEVLPAKPTTPSKPLIAKPQKPNVLVPIQGPLLMVKSQEQLCQESVQGKIAWDYRGSKGWGEANLQRLCQGTTKGSEPGRCFNQVMHQGVSWGGGTTWQWKNALDLCQGTSDASRTIRCFEAGIRRGRNWQQAIPACSAP